MARTDQNPYGALNKVFHEPSRLAIMSALCGSENGMTFNELKDECSLTDGNLSRHLKTLEEAQAIGIRKSRSGSRPRTTVQISDFGREGFIEYLVTLEQVLHRASETLVPAANAPSLKELFSEGLAANRI